MSDDAPFIVIEGIDGAGTTTQARRLVDWLAARGRPAHLTREPSDGEIGLLIRRVLRGEVRDVPPASVALLFAADRLDHLAREIEPRRRAGFTVLSDRYVLSSLAYQAVEAPREFVVRANGFAPPPDLTLFVDVPAEVALERRRLRGGPDELFDALPMQRRVAERYREEAAAWRDGPIVVVDGRPGVDEVFGRLCEALLAHGLAGAGRG